MLGQTHLHMQLACVWLPWVEGLWGQDCVEALKGRHRVSSKPLEPGSGSGLGTREQRGLL